MSTLAQTYILASKVKLKLTKEAVNPNANLRVLVCQANLLDNLMDSLQHKRPLPNFPAVRISSVTISEEMEDDDEDLSSSSDEEEIEIQRVYSSSDSRHISISQTEVEDYEIEDSDDDSDLEDYQVSEYGFGSMGLFTEHDIEDDGYSSYESDDDYYSDSSIASDEEDDESPLTSPEEESVFLSLSKLNRLGESNFKLVSVKSNDHSNGDMPSLTHCSSASDEEELEEQDLTDHHQSHIQKTPEIIDLVHPRIVV